MILLSATTDSIQAGCAIVGIIGLIITSWKLLSRDYDRENQIMVLTNLAKSQKESLDQFSAQTSQLIYQSQLMKEYNDLFSKYVEHWSILGEKRAAADESKMNFEISKHLVEIRPRFSGHGIATFQQGRIFSFSLINNGKTAKSFFITPSNESEIGMRTEPFELGFIESGHAFTIRGNSLKDQNVFEKGVSFNIEYKDAEDNVYTQSGLIQSPNHQLILGEPKLYLPKE